MPVKVGARGLSVSTQKNGRQVRVVLGVSQRLVTLLETCFSYGPVWAVYRWRVRDSQFTYRMLQSC